MIKDIRFSKIELQKCLRLSVENHVLASIYTLTPDLSLEWLSIFMFLYD
jgi:hypothetical protein